MLIEKSEKYILNLVELIKSKHKVYDDVFLFGFSQGGNQGLQTALSNPKIFRYFAALSGGYTSLTEKQINNSGKRAPVPTKILCVNHSKSGDDTSKVGTQRK